MKSKQFLDAKESTANPLYAHSFRLGMAESVCETAEYWLDELCGYADMCPHGNDPSTCPELIHECRYLIAEIKSSVKRIIHH